ncbi:MAG: DEAD/DEAH box helicase [Burkholderiales bacterium]|nr:DEAD/DEAH box helicase [Nitrosomonas sp.]MCP5273550.1 DEAD/DEAH box helicase [Burkholderiales bacterium]
MSFEDLNLHPLVLKAIQKSGYTTPTPIQQSAIPELISGTDVIASAQTGTGKTAAFMLPALHHLAEPSKIRSRGPRVLVLTPTRELAEQVSNAAKNYGKYLSRMNVISILGGMPYSLQNKLLSQPVDVLVATPGRLIDHIQRGHINFSRLQMLVLDEADRMLDMGFIADVEQIASVTPKNKQTVMFSATLNVAIEKIAERLLKSPKRIQIASQKERLNNIEQRLHYVDNLTHKNKLLDHVLRDETLKQAIVFTATKRDADLLADNLYARGHTAAALHGDMNQRERNRTLTRLRKGGLRILVATDVAARGIDISDITHVINFDLPKFAEDYVHRIGRTGRAGAAGIAVSFATHKDGLHLKRIERFTGHSIASHIVPGLEPSFKPNQRTNGFKKSTAPAHQKRKNSIAAYGKRQEFNPNFQRLSRASRSPSNKRSFKTNM